LNYDFINRATMSCYVERSMWDFLKKKKKEACGILRKDLASIIDKE
jgi:hypothetical protein